MKYFHDTDTACSCAEICIMLLSAPLPEHYDTMVVEQLCGLLCFFKCSPALDHRLANNSWANLSGCE